MILNGIAAVVLAYLSGSILAAYIVTRFQTGKDIRKLGGGNAGAHNVLRQVGLPAAAVTAVFDVGKGAVAVFTARWLQGFPDLKDVGVAQAFILAAALAVVAGHIWSIFFRFTGGNGLSPTIGAVGVLLPVELLFTLGMAVVLAVITRNLILSVNISLVAVLPLVAWRLNESWLVFIFLLILALMLVLHFVPDAKDALVSAGNKSNLFAELMRTDKPKKKR